MSQRVEPARLVTELPDTDAPTVRYNPALSELREFASRDERTTEYGGPRYISDQKSRSADRTKTLVDDEFTEADWGAIEAALAEAPDRDFVCLDRQVDHHPDTFYTGRNKP